MTRWIAVLLLGTSMAHAQAIRSGPWEMQDSRTTSSLRGIRAVGGGVAWASGTDGTVLRTEDSGYMWQSCEMPPGAEKLDFRGIWAWDADTAVIMSSGPGDQSRIYKTTDGCSHWKLLYTNPDKDGFWDAVVFQTRNKGFILGDPVNGKFVFLTTEDGGHTWKASAGTGLESAGTAKGAFAASNSSLLADLKEPVLFGTAGAYVYAQSFGGSLNFAAKPRTSTRLSEQWIHSPVPLSKDNDASGVFSLGYRKGEIAGYSSYLIAVGGDYTKSSESNGTAAWSTDGGKTWTAATKPPHGYRSTVAWDADAKAWIAAGTTGSDISYDDGKTWQPLDDGNWNAISLPWIVGPKGKLAKLGALPSRK